MQQLPKPYEIYRHFKGGLYELTGIARHSESLEEMIVYKHAESEELWVRPASMWNEDVVFEGKKVKRFELIEEK